MENTYWEQLQEGNAGNLIIKATKSILLSGSTIIDLNTDAVLSSKADEHDGNAGDISLIAGKDLILKDNVKITSSETVKPGVKPENRVEPENGKPVTKTGSDQANLLKFQ